MRPCICAPGTQWGRSYSKPRTPMPEKRSGTDLELEEVVCETAFAETPK